MKTKLEQDGNLGRCPCEQDLINARVSVDPEKSPNTTAFALDVFNNVYTSAATFMAKQGMNLTSYTSDSHFVIPEESCYWGAVEDGEFELDEGVGLASIAFRLEVPSSILKFL